MTREDVVNVLCEGQVHETWHNQIIKNLDGIIRPSRRPDIIVCNSCQKKGGCGECYICNYGDLFEEKKVV